METTFSCNTKFDEQFKEIKGLTWLPWVGKNYSNLSSNNQLIIVGESNYDWGEEGSKDCLKNPEFTRIIIQDDGIDDPESNRKIMRNIERVFYDFPTREQKIKLWQSVVYYNLVQRYMETYTESKKDRPTDKDYLDGWNIFFKIIKVLKPSYCLFCGVASAKHFQSFENNGCQSEGIKHLDKVGSTLPRTGTVISVEHSTKLIFIKHPSSYFPWESWAEFIEQQMGDYTTWLRKN